MVISGEKAPAFSARTLQLPPAQADNSAAIIAYTRENYSKRREDVEKAINDLINPPDHLQRKGPGNPGFKPAPHENDLQAQSAAQAKQWPVDAGAKPVVSEPNRPKIIADTPAGQAALSGKPAQPTEPTSEHPPAVKSDEQPVKKKRSRSRRKKSTTGEQPQGTPNTTSAPQPQVADRPDPTPAPTAATPKPVATPPATAPTSQPKPAQPERDTSILRIR